MKRIITSAGLVVLGAAGAQAVGYAPGFASTDLTQPWSVGLTMNGFYDSNPLTYPTGGWPTATGTLPLISSWGYELSPYVSGAYSTDQTQIGARYTFSMDFYANFPNNKTDYSQIFTLFANHRFNERFALNFNDNFAYSQEPEVLGATAGNIAVPYRTQQNSLANNASFNFTSSLSETLSLVLGYSNRYISYQQSPQDVTSIYNPLGGGSLQALLNRVENYVLANLEYKLSPQAMVLGGFQYGQIDYIGDGYLVSGNPDPATNPMSESRNSRNYYVYAGGSYTFNPDLSLSLKAGGQYTDLYNSPSSYTGWNAGWAPYIDLSFNWRFTTRGTLQVGFTESFAQTYVLAANSTTMVPYLNASYSLTEKITLSGLAKVSSSTFNGGAPGVDGAAYNLWMLGLNASYALNRHLSFDVGYNYDNLDSDAAATAIGVYGYSRNRVYFGVTARY
jgi:hypothetical protein